MARTNNGNNTVRAPRGNARGKGSDAQSRVESGEELTHEAARTRGKQKRPAQKNTKKGKVRVAMLGGLGEIGKNIAVIESGNDIIVVDCGLGFPDDDMLGVDLVIPDVSYLEKNEEKVRGIFITHGHEDHIGALPYVLRNLHVPVYATRLTLGVLERKLSEFHYDIPPVLNCVEAGDTVKAGVFSIEFIRVNHSIADACALAIHTPAGVIIHSGDFKLDLTPVESQMMDITRLGELGNEGVMLLMCESTNAERPGFTPSERKVGGTLDEIFLKNKDSRIVIATFSSNVHRVQQIISHSEKFGRKVAITGRSMVNIVGVATELGYMTVSDGVLIDIADVKKYPPEQVTVITTGSQGEPMSALYRMAFGDHSKISLGERDLVVISASAIPGNEKMVDRIINELLSHGVTVWRNAMLEIHVSGHACQEELKLMHALTKPKYFMPIHGEYKHMIAHKELAEYMGMPASDIFVSEIGKVLEIDEKGARWNGTIPSGKIMVDGSGVGDVGNIVLRDRRHLSQDGLIIVVATVDIDQRVIVSGPDIVSRGFVYVREAEEMMEEVREISRTALDDCLWNSETEWNQMKTSVKDSVSKFLFQRTKRRPMILPVIMNV